MFGIYDKLIKDVSEEEPIMHADARYYCHRDCEKAYDRGDIYWFDTPICKAKCDKKYGAPEKSQSPEHHSQKSAYSDIKSTLTDIGDNFYHLADSVSVL